MKKRQVSTVCSVPVSDGKLLTLPVSPLTTAGRMKAGYSLFQCFYCQAFLLSCETDCSCTCGIRRYGYTAHTGCFCQPSVQLGDILSPQDSAFPSQPSLLLLHLFKMAYLTQATSMIIIDSAHARHTRCNCTESAESKKPSQKTQFKQKAHNTGASGRDSSKTLRALDWWQGMCCWPVSRTVGL